MGNRTSEVSTIFPYTIPRDYLSDLDHVTITALNNPESLVCFAPKYTCNFIPSLSLRRYRCLYL